MKFHEQRSHYFMSLSHTKCYQICYALTISLVWMFPHSAVKTLFFLSTNYPQQSLKTTTAQGFCLRQTPSSSFLVCWCPVCKSTREESKWHILIRTLSLKLVFGVTVLTCYIKVYIESNPTDTTGPGSKHSDSTLYSSPGVQGERPQLSVQHSKGESVRHWPQLQPVLTAWPLWNHSAKV